MRIMIDTNVLVSASLFPKSRLGQAIKPLSDKYTIVLCTTIIDEENVDVLITGDNDFSCVEIERPEIFSPAEFLDKY